MYSPMLIAAAEGWVIGKNENGETRPLTKNEIAGACEILNMSPKFQKAIKPKVGWWSRLAIKRGDKNET